MCILANLKSVTAEDSSRHMFGLSRLALLPPRFSLYEPVEFVRHFMLDKLEWSKVRGIRVTGGGVLARVGCWHSRPDVLSCNTFRDTRIILQS